MNKILFLRAELSSQLNWEESTEFPRTPSLHTCTASLTQVGHWSPWINFSHVIVPMDPKPIVYVRIHSQCCVFYEFWQIHNDMYSPLCLMQSSFPALKTLCAPPIHPSFPHSLATSDLFIGSIFLPFPKYHMVEIIQFVTFLNWLLSLSIHLRFILFRGLIGHIF